MVFNVTSASVKGAEVWGLSDGVSDLARACSAKGINLGDVFAPGVTQSPRDLPQNAPMTGEEKIAQQPPAASFALAQGTAAVRGAARVRRGGPARRRPQSRPILVPRSRGRQPPPARHRGLDRHQAHSANARRRGADRRRHALSQADRDRDRPHCRRNRRPDETRRRSSPAHSLHAGLRAAVAVGAPRRVRKGQSRHRHRSATRWTACPTCSLITPTWRSAWSRRMRTASNWRPNCAAPRSSQTPILAVASREYLARAPPINEPRDLLTHQLLHEENFNRWRNWLSTHGIHEDVELTRHAAMAGPSHAGCGADTAAASSLTNYADRGGRPRQRPSGGRRSRANPRFQPQAMGSYQFIAKREKRWDAPLIRRFRQWMLGDDKEQHPAFKAGASEPRLACAGRYISSEMPRRFSRGLARLLHHLVDLRARDDQRRTQHHRLIPRRA